MKKIKRALAIDLGASSGRGIVFEFDGEDHSSKIVHRFANGAVEKDGKLYWDLSMLFENICEAISLADKTCGKLDAVGIDSWGVDIGFIDKQGEPVGDPRNYRDVSHAKVRTSLADKAWDFYQISGISDNDFNTTYQLIARAREDFDFSQIKYILFIPQLLGYMLTGRAVAEPTIASTGGFYRHGKGFDEGFLQSLGIDRSIFPPIVKTSSVIGDIKKEIKEKRGIDYQLPVIATPGHDTACAVHTVSSKEKHPLYLSSGTWSLFGTLEDEPIITRQTFESGYTNELASDGRIRLLRNIMGMWIIQECRKQWASEGDDLSFDKIVELAKSAEDKRAVIDVNSADFAYPGAMADKVRDHVMKNQGIRLEGKGEIALCVYVSLAKAYKNALDDLKKVTNRNYSTLYVLGGGSNNEFLNALIEKELNIKVVKGESEASALGNAMCCVGL